MCRVVPRVRSCVLRIHSSTSLGHEHPAHCVQDCSVSASLNVLNGSAGLTSAKIGHALRWAGAVFGGRWTGWTARHHIELIPWLSTGLINYPLSPSVVCTADLGAPVELSW